MIRHIFIFLFLSYAFQNTSAQNILTVRQVGLTSDSIPPVLITDVEGQKPTRINDSTIQFIVPPTRDECLFIILDVKAGWFTRIWIDSTVPKKELLINYVKKTALVKNGNEIDQLLEKVLDYSDKQQQDKADSISVPYVIRHQDDYFSLWLLYHGLNREHPRRNLVLLENLSPRLKAYPQYRQMRANLDSRKYPKYGDPFKEFTLEDKSGKAFNSTGLKNKIIVLHFWSTLCAPCVRGMDDLVKFNRSFDTSKVIFISVSMDKIKTDWKTSTATNKIVWANLWTEDNYYCELCLHYNLVSMPYFVIFDREKKLTFYNDGEDLVLLKSKIQEIDK